MYGLINSSTRQLILNCVWYIGLDFSIPQTYGPANTNTDDGVITVPCEQVVATNQGMAGIVGYYAKAALDQAINEYVTLQKQKLGNLITSASINVVPAAKLILDQGSLPPDVLFPDGGGIVDSSLEWLNAPGDATIKSQVLKVKKSYWITSATEIDDY